MFLPGFVNIIIEKLNKCGYEAYAVGGCVRDNIIGNIPKDYDVTTNALPEQIKNVFSDYRTIDTGIKYGTVTVISDGTPVEITTYRMDGDYSDSRRPDNVSFSAELSVDLERRDFTMNALAYSSDNGIIDIFGGRKDISEKIIRTVGNPVHRFNEDALRIMRALRFSSCLGFGIEKKTAEAIHSLSELLKNISAERIRDEFDKLICGKNCVEVIREYHDVISVILPELEKCVGFDQHTKYHDKDVFEHTLVALDSIRAIPYLRLTMLLHDIGKPEYFTISPEGVGHFKGHSKASTVIAEKFLHNMKYDNETTEKVLFLVSTHDIIIENREPLMKRYMFRYGEENVLDMIDVHIADDSGKAPKYRSRITEYQKAKDTVYRIIAEKQCFSLKDLAVNGRDMIELGLKGRQIGEMLDYLLLCVIEGKIANNKEELLKEAVIKEK